MASKRAPDSVAKLPDAAWTRSLARRLLTWFARHRRDLPWRRTRDPYRVWVSEIMLQQTQVATVVPYFERFVAAFPTVDALARAEEHEVLRHWEGLGYYRRARQMHRTAQVVVARHDGRFPRSVEGMVELPGIGRYTAGAIASIAFDLPAPILEANTVRLLSRLFAFDGDPAASAGQRLLWQLAAAVLPSRECGAFNQAMMELGSLICTPRAPVCHECPVHDLCTAFQRGLQDRLPNTRRKAPSEAVREAAVVVWRDGKVLLRHCAAGERWGGLWDLLRFELTTRRGAKLRQELAHKVREQSGLAVQPLERIATLKHTVTRFRITLDCYATRVGARRAKLSPGTWRWVDPADLDKYALSVTGRKLCRLLDGKPARKPAAANSG